MINISDKEKCCACGACAEKCGVRAITLIPDEYGNYYPHVDKNKCIDCGLCEKVCPIIHTERVTDFLKAYAVQLKASEKLKSSASGGAFFALAESFINNGGIVCGCAYDDTLMPKHISVVSCDQLHILQGSKYVRSSVEIYRDIFECLKKGKSVLFSGTPCQCQAVRLFCKQYDVNLVTVELICHGVVDKDYWMDYIQLLEKKHRAQIVTYSFRSEKFKGRYMAEYKVKYNKNTLLPKKTIFYETPATSYYYSHFLKGKIVRECCYSCPYARNERAADITIGDYWGYSGAIDKTKGVSAVIVNSDKGQVLFDGIKKNVYYEEQTFENIAENNEQLNKPCDIRRKDYSVLCEWKKNGSRYVEKKHHRRHWKAYLLSKIGVIK